MGQIGTGRHSNYVALGRRCLNESDEERAVNVVGCIGSHLVVTRIRSRQILLLSQQ